VDALTLFATSGADVVDSDAAARLLLNDSGSVWIVERGQVDLFGVELRDGRPAGPRRFLWSAAAPAALFGLAACAGERPVALLVVGASGASLRRVPLPVVRALADQPETAGAVLALVEAFVADASAALVQTFERQAPGSIWDELPEFCVRCSGGLADRLSGLEAAERTRLAHKAGAERRMRERGLAGLADVLDERSSAGPAAEADPLLAACQAVGAAARIEFRAPPAWEIEHKVRDPLASICRASRVRQRRVALRGRWWRSSSGPLLAYRADGRRPVAVLPAGHHGYELFDPASGTRIAVTRAVSAELEPFAFEFYPPSPDTPITFAALGRMIFREMRGDLARLILAALAGSVLGLVLPIATGRIFSDIIPMAAPRNIVPLLAALVSVTIASTLFDLTRAFALIRIEGRTNASLQAAIIDRLLALPVPFFRAYTTGDLAMRAGAINSVRELLSGAAVTTLLSGGFSLVNLILLFYYSRPLALVAVGVLAVTIAFTTGLAVATIRLERRRQAVGGAVAGLVFEIIGGISKLRVAGAEGRAFAVWTAKFREQRALAYRGGTYANAVTVFNEMLPIVSNIALFGTAGYLITHGTDMNTGAFVAFNAAFGGFFASGVSMSNTLVRLLTIVPIMERARPILEARLETSAARPDPGALTGRVEMSHVSFQYDAAGPPILRDVSLHAEPGEFVALVGPSGSGKSTLLRLLLGFETPGAGAIYYDGQDLGVVDLTAVRAQMGVVLQSSRLLAGDIFENIVGSSLLTLDDAWQAAEGAGLADDIREMPMGMHTMISEGGSTLSGGQRQRMLIARALVRRPRIVLFDEATSALDNRTQDIVRQTLDAMKATRIVIAHRVSTIRNADRIYVVDDGRIVQHGSYDELAAAPGLFAELIDRQLL
jgi:NHLM bacteriocin system ABC transporter ATP-binding protein